TTQSITKETMFGLMYEIDATIPIEISECSIRISKFSRANSEEGVRSNLDMIDEVMECAKVRGEALKRRRDMKHKSKVISTQLKVVDSVLQKAHFN
ncbi:hypothetical protein PHAVU_001G123500, partial [Phaseolus vulgaris]